MYNIRKIIVSFIRKRRGIENGGFIMFKAKHHRWDGIHGTHSALI